MLLFHLLASLLLLPTFSTVATGVANGLVVEKPLSWIPDEAAIGFRSINENQVKGNERRRGISVPKLGQDVEAVVPRFSSDTTNTWQPEKWFWKQWKTTSQLLAAKRAFPERESKEEEEEAKGRGRGFTETE